MSGKRQKASSESRIPDALLDRSSAEGDVERDEIRRLGRGAPAVEHLDITHDALQVTLPRKVCQAPLRACAALPASLRTSYAFCAARVPRAIHLRTAV